MKELQRAFATRVSRAATGCATATFEREEGQTFVEYAMILALIAVLIIGALTFLHDQVAGAYSAVANAI